MGASSSSGRRQYRQLFQNYQLIQQCKQEHLSYLQSKSTQEEYLLREMNCSDSQSFNKTKQLLERRQKQLEDNRHLASLKRIIGSQQDQYCMTFYKLHALWQFPQRTLEDEINQRLIQKRRFQEKQLWSILASCILGLSHLQKEDIKHNAIKSGTILISPDGMVKLYDPLATGSPSNYDKLLAQRSQPHLYLSPEQTQSLKQEKAFANCDPYKTDIWTLGMVLLQAGLLSYQDQCYRDQFSSINWQILRYNMNRFQQTYSPQLANLLEFMLAKDERSRPDWAELQEHVIKIEEDNVNQPQTRDRQNFLTKIFGSIRPQTKVEAPSEPQTKLLFFEKRPLSTSIEPRSNSVPISQGTPIMKPSDISSTRPLRNIFPSNHYITHTQIDENVIEDVNQSSFNDRSVLIVPQIPHKTNAVQQGSPQKAQFVRQSYAQGSRFEGYKCNGLKHGNGKFYYQDGGMYDGGWVRGKMEGFGRLYYQSQRLAYQGEWRDDQFCGKGVLFNQYPEQLKVPFDFRNFNEVEQLWTRYEGEFEGDVKQGRGRLLLSNSQFYEGGFVQDLVQGRGTFHTMSGEIISGHWNKNILIQ